MDYKTSDLRRDVEFVSKLLTNEDYLLLHEADMEEWGLIIDNRKLYLGTKAFDYLVGKPTTAL